MIDHGGNLYQANSELNFKNDKIIDFSANINPLGMFDGVKNILIDNINNNNYCENYPEANAQPLVNYIAEFYNIKKTNLVVGNGANQLIHLLPKLLINEQDKVLLLSPLFSEYEKALINHNKELKINFCSVVESDFQINFAKLHNDIKNHNIVVMANPNTPAGFLENKDDIISLANDNMDVFFVIDESFIDFCEGDNNSLLNSDITKLPPNIIVIKSLTKIFALAGVRLGFAVSSNEKIMKQLKKLVPAWSVNNLAISAGLKIFENRFVYDDYIGRSKSFIADERSYLVTELSKISQIKLIKKSNTDFLLIQLLDGNVDSLRTELLHEYSILIRDCNNFRGLEKGGYFRIAVKKHVDNEKIITALNNVFSNQKSSANKFKINKNMTPSVMFQGTCSNAGKSILTAAMCRILHQDGIKVAPFKAQNMALNSFVTENNNEIGRAQALQAMAANIIADVRMNPVLLKPNNDLGSQVIVMGQPTETLQARDYYKRKQQLFGKVKSAYDSLADEYDCIVLEGAGSPGEINLKQNDIVNMNMAKHAQSNVLLVGDIDRGGVYASFIGTYATFLPWERELLKGFIVNKFRGDASLLNDAHKYLFNYTQKPCLGIVPTFNDIKLPEEDSVSFDLPVLNINDLIKNNKLDVVVIGLRHISNFTDIAPLTIEKDLIIRKVIDVNEFGTPDVVIIPGSKNVISDMNNLKNSGLDKKIIDHANNNGWVIGICGGLQLCGDVINDPFNIESSEKNCQCLSLLPLETNLAKEKFLSQTVAELNSNCNLNSELLNYEIKGYEIHHGKTICANNDYISMYNATSKQPIGFTDGKRIWTTYLHGVFDNDKFRNQFLNIIRKDFNMAINKDLTTFYDVDGQLNKLADHVRNNMDIDKIYQLMGL